MSSGSRMLAPEVGIIRRLPRWFASLISSNPVSRSRPSRSDGDSVCPKTLRHFGFPKHPPRSPSRTLREDGRPLGTSSVEVICDAVWWIGTDRNTQITMVSRIHQVEQHRSRIQGIEAMTLVSNHHFPRHSHDQLGIGVIAFGAQRSWSGVGAVNASAGDVIMVNPGEVHDGAPLDGNPRGWRMIYIDPALVVREVEEEIAGQVEIVHPVARDRLLAAHFARLFGCLIASQSDRLAVEENLLRSLVYVFGQHGMARQDAQQSMALKLALRDPENPTLNLGLLALVRFDLRAEGLFEAAITVCPLQPFGGRKGVLPVRCSSLFWESHAP
jgi:hypothetical protein